MLRMPRSQLQQRRWGRATATLQRVRSCHSCSWAHGGRAVDPVSPLLATTARGRGPRSASPRRRSFFAFGSGAAEITVQRRRSRSRRCLNAHKRGAPTPEGVGRATRCTDSTAFKAQDRAPSTRLLPYGPIRSRRSCLSPRVLGPVREPRRSPYGSPRFPTPFPLPPRAGPICVPRVRRGPA